MNLKHHFIYIFLIIYSFNNAISQNVDYQNLTKKELLSILKKRNEKIESLDKTDNTSRKFEFLPNSVSSKEDFLPTLKNRAIFGFDFFNTNNLTFKPSTATPVTDDYILGFGDEIFVNIYGYSQKTYILNIERNGAIIIPSIGPIFIGGLTLKDARKSIKTKLKSIYQGMRGKRPNTFANISLGELRSINVNVIGEANVPGTYAIPAGSFAFSALYLAGGPNENGSFRKIDVIRNGETIHSIDVYKYLVDGNSLENIQLRNQDVILIRPYINRIILEGEFKRIGLFETKNNETLEDIIRYAGGFTENAYTHRLKLERNNNRTRTFKDVIQEEFSSLIVRNGDILTASEVIDKFENRVFISGAVYKPGAYELTTNMNLYDLINKAEGIKEDAFLERGVLIRKGEDLSLKSISFNVKDVNNNDINIPLIKEDSVIISSVFDLSEKKEVEIKGFVNNPGIFNYSIGMTLKDIIFLSGGFKENAGIKKVEVARKLTSDEIQETADDILYSFELSVDRNLNFNEQEFQLLPFDKIYVRQAPGYIPFGSVEVKGAIESPGVYSILSLNDKISDIIKRAGKLKKNANTSFASLTRKRKLTQQEYDSKLRIAIEQSIIDSTTVEEIDEIETYNVGLDLYEILKSPYGKNDIIVQDGDEIIIPEYNQTVRVSGAVLNPTAIVFNQNFNVRDYINLSGGFSLNAKKSKVYVVYPNGNSHASKNFIFIKYPEVQPGSNIIVLEKKKTKSSEAFNQWLGISATTATLVSTVLGIIALKKD